MLMSRCETEEQLDFWVEPLFYIIHIFEITEKEYCSLDRFIGQRTFKENRLIKEFIMQQSIQVNEGIPREG